MNYITPDEFKIAEENGINNKLVYERVNRYNWSVKRAITQKVQRKRQDETYKYWSKVAHKSGVGRLLFRQRVQLNWDYETAATLPPMTTSEVVEKARKANTCKVATPEQYAIALNNGIKPNTLRARLRRLWTIEKAISVPVKRERNKKVWRF